MAAHSEEPKRRGKRKRDQTRPKLLLGEKVEVRSFDEGFLGSWHMGKVVYCKKSLRHVQYDHLLCDDGSCSLTEIVRVSPLIEGVKPAQWDPNSHRGVIRPLPPSCNFSKSTPPQYGQCVDSFIHDAWWEGVVFDQEDGSEERKVFFPDQGDDMMIRVDNLRITLDWNELTEEWKPRGNWGFLEIINEVKKESPLFASVKQIWYEVREKSENSNPKEWTFCGREYWRELVSHVIFDNLKITVNQFLGILNSSECFVQDGPLLEISEPVLKTIMKPETFLSASGHQIVVVPEHLLPNVESGSTSQYGEQNHCENPKVPPSKKLSSSKRKKYRSWNWVPLVLEPEFCPDAIIQFRKMSMPRKPDILTKVRKHLTHLGWKIKQSNSGRNSRLHYLSPSGKSYVSLHKACNELEKASEPRSVIHKKRSRRGFTDISPAQGFLCLTDGTTACTVPEDSSEVVIDSQYCPQAVSDYMFSMRKENGTPKRRGNPKFIDEARKHLVFCGWRIFKYCKMFRFLSPNGHSCYSLLAACKYHVMQSETKNNIVNVNVIKSQKAIPVDSEVFRPSKVRTKRNVFNQESVDANLETTTSTRLKRSSKTVVSSAHRMPRNILSWLIDNEVIRPETTVRYCGRKDGRSLKEGSITRDGIKCNCCLEVYSITNFEVHAGSTNHRPSANIFLEDGRSLLECQFEMKQKLSVNKTKIVHEVRDTNQNDHICSICHDGGELILCDQCPSSFHTSCLGLKVVPDGDWFCPSCCCGICGQSKFNKKPDEVTDESILYCHQCGHQYHFGCVKVRDKCFLKQDSYPVENWFCNRRCERIFSGLHQFVGKPISVGTDKLTLTFLKCTKSNDSATENEYMTENYGKLGVALDVMHECFDPIIESRTRRDIMEDVIFSRWSELNRLNFQGFYTVVLEKNDELITVATVRVHDEKVAEIPFIGTRFQYRRLGMCRFLMNVLEKKLKELGVERLVLPAVSSALDTWTTSFGFSVMQDSERLRFLNYTFLDFHGTVMCQKMLTSTDLIVLAELDQQSLGHIDNGNGDFDESIAISEVFQVKKFDGDESIGKESLEFENASTCSGLSAMLSESKWRSISYQQQQHSISLRSQVQINSSPLPG
ncbi:unnamed protein product [Cuscuta europaea]|uniref:Uncharacterized protein n=1 Tax=Cuscuta europaea TaxID=41803 RepID=A0A9P1EC06_CUSEU|nr:unnamed protein product [Cuscuta europaea]